MRFGASSNGACGRDLEAPGGSRKEFLEKRIHRVLEKVCTFSARPLFFRQLAFGILEWTGNMLT
jgi:hypothetical protein